jgi:hypothetical protein
MSTVTETDVQQGGTVRNYGDFPRLLERILITDEPQHAGL